MEIIRYYDEMICFYKTMLKTADDNTMSFIIKALKYWNERREEYLKFYK